MKRLTALALAGAAALAACSDNSSTLFDPAPTLSVSGTAGAVTHVTSAADAGSGSFRAAVEAANTDPGISRIAFEKGVGPVSLATPIVFTGSQAMVIDGNDVVLDGGSLGAAESIFLTTGGGDLEVRNLTVRNAPGSGIEVQVPAGSTGTLQYGLVNLTACDNGGHGAVINDQADPVDVANEAGSAAGLVVRVSGSRFEGNGFGAGDRDGLRINEGGAGSLHAVITQTVVLANGGDGIELDERGVGDVVFDVQHTQFSFNGELDPADLEDGLDVDESQDGSAIGRFVQVSANDNFEEGLDLNENHAGDMRIEMSQVETSRNGEEGVDLEEDDDFAGGGDLIASLRNVTANGNTNGDAGIKIRERGDGNLNAELVNPAGSSNARAGISLREDAAGNLDATVVGALTAGNGSHGVIYDENSDGELTGALRASNSSDNAGAGVRAEQATTGAGLLRIEKLTAVGNIGGAISSSGVTVDQAP